MHGEALLLMNSHRLQPQLLIPNFTICWKVFLAEGRLSVYRGKGVVEDTTQH